MTDAEARAWVADRFGSSGVGRMQCLAALVTAEAAQQNLIAASTLDQIWPRHIVDSAQLIGLADATPGRWIDIGTGAGFPGLVVAALTDREVVLVEPRRRRAGFLHDAVQKLGLAARVSVLPTRIQTVDQTAAIISARAVAAAGSLFALAAKLSSKNTLWLLPKGRGAHEEVAQAQRTWHGMFHVEQSITDPASFIIVASKVSPR